MRRLAAFIIDHLLLSTLLGAVLWQIWDWPFDYSFPYEWHHFNFNIGFMGHNFFKEIFIIIYYALMESSKYQATLGKIIMGIRVTNINGAQIDFSKALLRNLSKILSALILCIGYIMILFDDKKQGLHDKIADTVVVRV